MSGLNEVTERPSGVLVCTCGALCLKRIDQRRFRVRHPALCNERRQVARELSERTRAVDGEEGRMVWDKERKPYGL